MNFLHFTTNLLPIVTMIVLEPIGFVHNTCTTSQAPEFIKKEISEIEILPEYSEGLQDIEQAEYLDLVFSFHHEKRTELVTRIRSGEMKGVFPFPQTPEPSGNNYRKTDSAGRWQIVCRRSRCFRRFSGDRY